MCTLGVRKLLGKSNLVNFLVFLEMRFKTHTSTSVTNIHKLIKGRTMWFIFYIEEGGHTKEKSAPTLVESLISIWPRSLPLMLKLQNRPLS